MTLKSLPASLLLLLSLSAPLHALSSHSPQDLFAFPRYSVVLKQEGVLNDTVQDLLREHEEASSSEPSPTHPGAVHLLRTPAGQAFLCSVPAASDASDTAKQHEANLLEREAERERGLERGLALLEPMRAGCIYQKQNWFTYSFCYGTEIRQFHEVRVAGSVGPSEDPNADSYTLGQAPEPVSAQPPKYGSGSGLLAKKDQRIPAALGGGNEMGFGWDDGGRYLSQIWDDGTICDKTGMPRTVEVQFHCNTQTIDRIALIRETAICRYVMIIHTPRLCSEPVFLEGRDSSTEPSNIIECQPVVSKLRSSVDPPATSDSDTPLAPPTPVEEPIIAPPAPADPPHVEEGESFAELMETAGVVTLMYDPDTGEMLSAKTEDGREVFSEEDLRDAAREKGVDATAENQGRDVGATGGEEMTIEGLEELGDLARLMRESITEALRGVVAGDRGAQDDGANANDPVLVNGIEIQGLADLVGALKRGEEKKAGNNGAQGNSKQDHPGLAAYRKKLEEQLKQQAGMGGGLPERLGSEEHEQLKKGFGRRYEEEEEVDEKKERTRDEL